MVVAVGDVNVARAVHREAGGEIELGDAADAIGAARDTGQTGQRGDAAGRGDFADGVAGAIRHEEVARCVDGDVLRIIETSSATGPIGGSAAAGHSS